MPDSLFAFKTVIQKFDYKLQMGLELLVMKTKYIFNGELLVL